MIRVQSFMKVAKALVPIEEFVGPVVNDRYIDGSIELEVDGVVVLSRDDEDLVDQLWSYLSRGLVDVANGKDFMTGYPDSPIEIHLAPVGETVAIRIGYRDGHREATAPRRELIEAMADAGLDVFRRLTPHVPMLQASYGLASADLRRAAHRVRGAARVLVSREEVALPASLDVERELTRRIREAKGHHGGGLPERLHIAYRGYLAALFEWGVLAESTYVELLRHLPELPDDPSADIILGHSRA